MALAVGRLPALEGTDLAMRSAVEEPREGGHERSIDAMGNSGSPKRASEDSLRRHERGRCEVPGRAAAALTSSDTTTDFNATAVDAVIESNKKHIILL